MHICFLTSEYPKKGKTQGGVGSFVQTLGRELVNHGIKVSVVGAGPFDKVEKENDLGVDVYRIPLSTWKFARFYENSKNIQKKIKEIHKENPIDIVEGTELLFAFYPKNFGIKKVIRMHGGHTYLSVTLNRRINRWKSFQEKLSFSKADSIVCVSDFVGNTTKSLLGLDIPVKTIYNLVDVDKFYEADINKIKEHKLVCVGTVMEEKGVRQLVLALPKVIEKFPNTTLDLIGRDSVSKVTKGSYTEYLKGFITEELESHINITGPLLHDVIPQRLEEADVCVYPSHMEAMPIAWLEALGMGKSVIASQTGPGPEAVLDRKSGLLCDPHDPDDIAEKIIYMFEHQLEAREMGKKAREDVRARFARDTIVKENIDFYRSLI